MVTMVDRCARLSARRALVAQPDRRACASLWHYYGTLGPPPRVGLYEAPVPEEVRISP